jgi:hypothetical protein
VSFLYPAFLAGAVAIAIPIVLHFLRRDIAPEVPFSAVRLLRRSPIARSHRRRLRDLILLAARVAAVILLALAFARPYLAGASASSSLRIVAIDRSFSMGAPGTFGRAMSLAGQAIAEAGAGERVALIAFDDRADALAEPGAPASARAALATLKPGDGGTRYAAMLAKAAEISGLDVARLVIVSDLQRAGWGGDVHAFVPANLTLDVRDAGAAPTNVAVSAVKVTAGQVVASIRNEGKTGWSGEVRVERDGRIVAGASAVVTAASELEVPVAYHPPAIGSIAVSVEDPSGFQGDNRRFAILDPGPRPSVLIVTSGLPDSGYFVGRALNAALDGVDTRRVSASALPTDELPRQSAIVLLSTRGLDRRGREAIAAFVRGGGGLLVAGSSEVEPILLSTTFDWKPALSVTEQASGLVALSATDTRHPIFRPFGALTANFGQIRFDRAWRVTERGWATVARFTDGSAALLERREGNGRIALFTSDLDRRWNDFPLNPSYVPFVAETVRYIMPTRDTRRDYPIGAAPPGAGPQPGVYRTSADNRLVAVNVDPRESAVAAMTPAEFLSMIEPVQPAEGGVRDARARQIEARQHYWQYGLLFMLAALVAESFVGRV